MATAKSGSKWATIDPTLWNMAFTGHARVQRCKYCFSLYHQASECDWAPSSKSSTSSPNTRSRSNPVCKSWNFSTHASCEFNNYNYQHVCLLCVKDQAVAEKGHKIINSPKRQSRRQSVQTAAYSQVAVAQPPPSGQPQSGQQVQPQLAQPLQYQRYKPY